MRVRAIKDFLAKGTKVEVGSVFDVPEKILPKLSGLVEVLPRHRHDKPIDTWCVGPRAWLCDGELRTTGVFEDLAAEIAKITSDDHELQRRLLTEHCQQYAPSHIWSLVKKWEERATIMEHDGGMSKEQAEEEAARQFNLLAFLHKLRCGFLHYKPETFQAKTFTGNVVTTCTTPLRSIFTGQTTY